MATTLVNENAHTAFANSLLVGQGNLGHAGSARHFRHIGISVSVLHHGLLEGLISVLVDLFLDHVLLQHLVVELEWLLVDEFVVETLAIGRLNDVTLRVHAVLVALLCGSLMLTLELFLLLHSVVVMFDEAPSG